MTILVTVSVINLLLFGSKYTLCSDLWYWTWPSKCLSLPDASGIWPVVIRLERQGLMTALPDFGLLPFSHHRGFLGQRCEHLQPGHPPADSSHIQAGGFFKWVLLASKTVFPVHQHLSKPLPSRQAKDEFTNLVSCSYQKSLNLAQQTNS